MAKRNPCSGGCKDEDLTDYYEWGSCDTPFCGTWFESHCRKCGWYIITCRCGSSNGWSTSSCRMRRSKTKRRNVKGGCDG